MQNKRGRAFNLCFPKDSRGQGLSVNMIILIVLGLAILVVMVLGFTLGWQKILPFISTDNVETVVNQCQAACTTGSVYGFCSQERSLKSSDLPGGVKEIKGNCTFFSTDVAYTNYGVSPCPGLCPVNSGEATQ